MPMLCRRGAHREGPGFAVAVAEQRIARVRHRDLRGAGAGLHTLVILSTRPKVSGKFDAPQVAAAGRVAGSGYFT
jgi:hypothetical protein